jgi:DNA (cytosine-5)-methyltransferase 1
MTIYNEIDPYAAKWIGNLVAAGHVAPGEVETRSIRELQPGDVRDHVQSHFFAGIAVWSHALRSAGWPDDCPVWTGSCPCQPFSSAGRRRGSSDDRHLWPDWYKLIAECRPPVVFGEQVASPDGLRWLDAVRADLEASGYAFGAADLCAAGVGAPHIRQRLYFVALADRERLERVRVQLRAGESRQVLPQARGGSTVGGMAHGEGDGRGQGGEDSGRIADGKGPAGLTRGGSANDSEPRGLGDAVHEGPQVGQGPAVGRGAVRDEGQAAPETGTGFWGPVEWLPCQDGRFRPVEPGTFPLAHGVANRVGKLRAYGNAICGPVATMFIGAVMQAL